KLVAAVSVGVLLCTAWVGGAGATAPGANGRIMFTSDTVGLITWDLVSMGSVDSDGSDLVINDSLGSTLLGWDAISPDGTTWAYSTGFGIRSTFGIDYVAVGAVDPGGAPPGRPYCLLPGIPGGFQYGYAAGMYFLPDNRLALLDGDDRNYYACSPDGTA